MLLDLNKLRGEREHFERVFQPSAFDPHDDGYQVASPVELSMDAEKAGPGVFRVTGYAVTRLQVDCSRCLEGFELPVRAHFELRYVPQMAIADGAEREVLEDDLTTAYHREGALDVIEMLREQFQLALPMKPLCAEACKGLCPECGTNLNRTTCRCESKWEDPRLASLKKLMIPKEK